MHVVHILFLISLGDAWFKLFLRRNNTVGWRSPQELGYDRSIVSKTDILEWFGGLQLYLLGEVLDFEALQKDPRRIYNCDESGFPLQVKKRRVMAEIGSKNVYQCTTPGHEQVTVMASFNAAGDYPSPFIIFKGKRLRNTGISNFEEATYSTSNKGWMEKDNFFCFLKQLDDFIAEQEIPRPILLFMDGHSSHFSKETAEFCSRRQILLYCLPPHSSHILQPLDVGFFSSLKNAWRSLLLQWQRENPGISFTKTSFPGLFKKAWEQETTRDKAINGFRKCGLFPLDHEAVDYSKLVTRGPMVNNELERLDTSMNRHDGSEDLAEGQQLMPNEQMIQDGTPEEEVQELAVSPEDTPSYVSSTMTPPGSDVTSDEYSPVLPIQPSTVNQSLRQSLLYGDSSDEDVSVNASTSFTEMVANTSVTETDLNELPTPSRDQAYISPSFDRVLTVPEKTVFKKVKASKIPKAASGRDALAFFKAEEDAKRKAEVEKIKRKLEREKKRKQVEEEKERRKQQRMELKALREERKEAEKKSRRKPKSTVDFSSSEEDQSIACDDNVSVSDVPFSEMDKIHCCQCGEIVDDIDVLNAIGCDTCPRWIHKMCTNEQALMDQILMTLHIIPTNAPTVNFKMICAIAIEDKFHRMIGLWHNQDFISNNNLYIFLNIQYASSISTYE